MYARLKREGMSDRDLAGLQQQLYEERELRERSQGANARVWAAQRTMPQTMPPPAAQPWMPRADPSSLSQATRGLTVEELEGQRQQPPSTGMLEYLMRLFGR